MGKATHAILSLCIATILCIISIPLAFAEQPLITDLVLVGQLPLEAEIIRDEVDDQGNYLQELMVLDGCVSLVTMRQRVDEAHPFEMPFEDLLAEHFADIREAELLEVSPVAAYPTERIRFETNAEEDTAVIDAVLVRTDEFFFAFWADSHADTYHGYFDAFEEGEIPEMIDFWVESLDLFDTTDTAYAEEASTENMDGELPYWNGFDFGPNLEYAEEFNIEGDPGDFMSAAEAAKLTFDTMRDNGNVPGYSDDAQYTMTLIDLAVIEGDECYVYVLDIADSDGTLGAAYAYAYQSGKIYMEGQDSQWVQPA